MTKGTTQSRKHRRSQLRAMGYLKIKNMYSPLSGAGKAWYDKIREDGNQAHESHRNKIQDNLEIQIQEKLASLKTTWIEFGYNESELNMLEEAWLLTVFKNKITYREDKKKSNKLQKEAKELLSSRLNANS